MKLAEDVCSVCRCDYTYSLPDELPVPEKGAHPSMCDSCFRDMCRIANARLKENPPPMMFFKVA
jgi:hypothetical protein